MSKHFTKEYIKECDCKEIQGLRKELQVGDWYVFADSISIYKTIYLANETIERFGESQIWLPTGDQLDEEIVKICKERFYCSYESLWQYYINNPDCYYAGIRNEDDNLYYPNRNSNPLIAKILLLKELLK